MNIGSNRLGIFHIYDKNGVIDDYIPYMLNGVSRHLKDLYVVANGNISQQGLEKLKVITPNVIIRENVGFDAGGFKDVLINHIGWNKIKEYNELLLFNDSFFGPLDSFSAIFEEMAGKKVDFWTLTNTKGNEYSKFSVQSYFIHINQRLLHSDDFKNYWEDFPILVSFKDAVTKYEEQFAEYFESKGYISGVFVNNEDYFWGREQYNFSPYHDLQYELMAYHDYPIIKRKLFTLDLNSDSYGTERQGREQFTQALKYIKNQKNYKSKLIWENILRCYSLREIQESCCLWEVLSDEQNGRAYKEDEAVVFLVLRDRKVNYDNLNRLKYKNVHIVLISDSEEILNYIENPSFLSKERHLAFSMTEIIKLIYDRIVALERRYKYCCFISDFYWEKGEIPYTVGASKLWEDWECIIGRTAYINNVIKVFEENPECGLLVSPRPFHAHYFGERGRTVEFGRIKGRSFAEKNGLEEYICRSRKKAWWSNSFWTRLSLWKELLDTMKDEKTELISWDDFDCFCEILPYWYQKKGYYTEVICSGDFAGNRFTIEESCMETMIAQFKKIGEFQSYRELQILLQLYYKNIDKIQEFIRSHKKVYIYGAGEKAKVLSHLHCMDNIVCFVISDGREKCNTLNGRLVKYLSEVKMEADDGIILGLNEKNSAQVVKMLKEMKIKNDILQIEDGGIFNGGWLDFSI